MPSARRAEGRSLFNRLLLTLLGSLFVLWAAASGVAAWSALREAGAVHDRQLAQTAQVLLALAGQEIAEHLAAEGNGSLPGGAGRGGGDGTGLADLAAHLAGYAPPGGLAFHIHARGIDFQFRSGNFPAGLDDEGAVRGFADRELGGEAWRVYTREDEAGIVAVQVAQRWRERRRIGLSIVGAILPPLVAGLPLAVLLTLVHVRRARRPLADLADAVAERGPANLEPFTVPDPPRELRPILAALNDLVDRLRERLESERRFTGDAAHELRTPLAALQVDIAIASEHEGEDRVAALARLRAGVERAGRLVGQLLTLARLDPVVGIEDPRPVDLGACAQEVLAGSAGEAARRGVEVTLEEGGSVRTAGDPDLVEVLIRNLVENAIRYTPAGGRVEVSVGCDAAGRACVRVADSGPGIPEAERGRVRQRFYRRPGSGVPGTGLGLSIVERIAALHQADLALGDAALGGLEATVTFPPDRAAGGH